MIHPGLRVDFEYFFTEVSHIAHQISVEHGWWDEGSHRNKAELIALMHSELSEALEGLRYPGQPSDHIPEYLLVEEELADTVIRIMDMAAAFDLRVGSAIIAKMLFNEGRPHKHGGKAF